MSATGPMTPSSAVTPSRLQAAKTRRAAAPRIQPLSPPGSALSVAISPDPRLVNGKVLPLLAYDAGQAPPPLPHNAVGRALQQLDVDDTVTAVLDSLAPALALNSAGQGALRRRSHRLLEWLAQFPGQDWEQRWLASGADSAPRSWADAAFPEHTHRWERHAVVGGLYHLIQARVLRPSYAWLLNCRGGTGISRFLQANATAGLEQLRALPAYRQALARHQVDAEHCLARVMIRTGKPLEELLGEEVLHYADIVCTSGRVRREHLAWELLVGIGVFAGEPATLRAAWSAKGNTRQHSVATLVDRYGIPPGGVRDLLVDYLGEFKPVMDYSSLSSLAYRLVRLFWWEIVQINPQQTDLDIDSDTATTWRERLALTSDGRRRRDTHSILFSVRALYRDLAEWAHDDQVRWGIWVAPCPVPRTESRAAAKMKRRQKADTQARTRALTRCCRHSLPPPKPAGTGANACWPRPPLPPRTRSSSSTGSPSPATTRQAPTPTCARPRSGRRSCTPNRERGPSRLKPVTPMSPSLRRTHSGRGRS